MKISKKTTAILVLLFISISIPCAEAFNHPGIPFTTQELQNIKGNLSVEPWSSAYATLAADPHSNLNAVPYGPAAGYNNVNEYTSDMVIVYNCALMWQLTGNTAYADKGMSVLLSYATQQTTVGPDGPGYLQMATAAQYSITGADILRSYSGWTTTDTTEVQNWVQTFYWSYCGAMSSPQGTYPGLNRSANQGAAELQCAMAGAVFCDDVTEFNLALDAFRNQPCMGLHVMLPNGQIGDSGRDQGHAWGELWHYVWVAEIAWQQGVDLYSEQNNAILGACEYYSKYNLGLTVPFIPSGPCYGFYQTIGGSPSMVATPSANQLVYNHYVTLKGLSAPYTTQWLNTSTNTAANAIPWTFPNVAQPVGPPVAPAPAGIIALPSASSLTSVDIGSVGVVGSATYSSGIWTISGSGNNLLSGNDSGHFAYKQFNGNSTIIAEVTSQHTANANSIAGIMMRDSLAPNANVFALWVQSGKPQFQAGAYSTAESISDTTTVGTLPYTPFWLKISRNGTQFLAWISQDGVTWSPVNNAGVGRNVAMGSSVYAGLVVCSNVNTALTTATFSNVAIDTVGGPLNTQTYNIANLNSGLSLDVQGGLTANDTPLDQMPYVSGLNQTWSLTYLGSGYYRMIGTGSNLAVTVPGSSAANGVGIATWVYNPTANNQRWFMTPTSNGYYGVQSQRGNTAMEVSGSSTAPGALIDQWTYSGANNQQWLFQRQ
jgi:hypothetical protein